MKKRLLENTYQLPNGDVPMTPNEIRQSLNDFEFFMGNFQQIINKQRQVVPFKLNAFQKLLFTTLLPMVKKETRLDKRHHVVLCKPRQVGASVSIVAFINYICSFVDGMENLNIAHVFPVGDTITKFYQQKVMPIITGVHPDLFPDISRDTLSSSILTHYDNINNVRRNNFYELISSSASSIRSASIHVLLEDEVAFYKKPEELDSAIMPTLPPYGFSLVVYLSTFETHQSTYFREKIMTALNDKDGDWTLIFVPWFLMYPEKELGLDIEDVELERKDDRDYRDNVILPAMKEYGVPKKRWGDCVDWYFRQKKAVPHMEYEYPTTIEEVLEAGQNKCVFAEDMIERQRKNVMKGTYYRLLTDNVTGKVEAHKTELSPFRMFKQPEYGHRYKISVDPITAVNDMTDNFAMSVFDEANLEQVAVFCGKNMPLEDYADYAVSIAKLYNNAMIVPESNMAAAFVTSVYGLRYYNLYYQTPKDRKNRQPGIRTTASSKEQMIDNLLLLLENDRIILHDEATIDEMEWFEKRVKEHKDGSNTVKMMARKGKTDDRVACLWIYVGSLDQKQLSGTKKVKWSIL